MKWEDKNQVKKGNIGEEIIQQYLEAKGWKVYKPFTNGAHWFDMLACKDKSKVIAVDVKTKARFNKWNSQGVNVKSYNEYLNFVRKTKVPFYLIFVDDKNGDVHSAKIDELEGKGFTPGRALHIIAWKLSDMKYVTNIGQKNIDRLSMYDLRNYDFQPLQAH